MSIFVGESKKVEVNIEPMEAKDKPLTYISSDENIAKVDELGKGEAYKDYYINDIAGLNFSYDKISGAGVYKYKDGKPSFLMYGFIIRIHCEEIV